MEPEEKMEFKTRLGESCFLEEGVDVGGGGEGGGGEGGRGEGGEV